MRYSYIYVIVSLLFVLSSCSDDDEASTFENVSTVLQGTWEGDTYISFVPDGINEGSLSGSVTFDENGRYNSTLRPFTLAAASGSWTYNENTRQIIFNEGGEQEEVGENVILSQDSLQFVVYREVDIHQTMITFSLLRQQ